MFDKLQRELKDLEGGVKIPVNLPLDEDGYFDRECHAEFCHAEFKVLFQDWREKVSDDRVYCPVCRHEAPSGEWNTDEQHKYMKAVAIAHVQNVIHSVLTEDTRNFNRAQRPGFIQMSMYAKRGARPIIVPVDVAKVMRQKFVCEVCGCRYASIGAAFFCPACGHNSATILFELAINAVRKSINMIPAIREIITSTFNDDAAQDTTRQIIETGLGKLVSSFQRFAEQKFSALPNASNFKPRKNVFQNLKESSQLWRYATGKGYEDILNSADMAELTKLFQQRHLLIHKDGIIDQEYIDKSGDKTYFPEQRLVVKESSVLMLADLLTKLGSGL